MTSPTTLVPASGRLNSGSRWPNFEGFTQFVKKGIISSGVYAGLSLPVIPGGPICLNIEHQFDIEKEYCHPHHTEQEIPRGNFAHLYSPPYTDAGTLTLASGIMENQGEKIRFAINTGDNDVVIETILIGPQKAIS